MTITPSAQCVNARVARFYTFATGAGWHGWMPRAEQLGVLLMWRIPNDRWATPASRDAFMAGYRNAKWQAVTIDPADGHDPIGHMGYFRSYAKPMWESALQWFGEHTTTPPLPSQQGLTTP